MSGAPAYVVFIKEATHDDAEMARYKAQVGASFVGREVIVRAAYGEQEVLEGPPLEGVVILEFPSMEAARDWYRSPEYQAAAQHRFNGASYRAVMVAGRPAT
jgi:uncharacterized protein (DUF1330 family)